VWRRRLRCRSSVGCSPLLCTCPVGIIVTPV
jgi:hypothetical protein